MLDNLKRKIINIILATLCFLGSESLVLCRYSNQFEHVDSLTPPNEMIKEYTEAKSVLKEETQNVQIKKVDFVVDEDLLEPLIKEKIALLTQFLSNNAQRVILKDYTVPQSIKLKSALSFVTLKSLESEDHVPLSPYAMSYTDTLCVHGVTDKTCSPIIFQIRTEHKVFVANKLLPQNHIVTELDLDESWSSSSQNYATDPQLLVGKKAKMEIASGQILSLLHLERQVMVNRGVATSLTVKHNELDISTKGRPLQDGYLGDQIQVSLDQQNKKVIRAKVTGSGTLEAIQ